MVEGRKVFVRAEARRTQFWTILPLMLHIDLSALAAMEQRYRANFVNSLSGFKPAMLVGTADSAGQTNLAIFTQVFHLGANPALIGMVVRPDSVERHTLSNIRQQGHYTLNHAPISIAKAAHQTSARYPADQSEFDACGLTPWYTAHPAPYVAESPVRIGLRMAEEHPITRNGTILVIGEILEVVLEPTLVQQDGYVDIEKAGIIAVSGLDSYHRTERLFRLAYAKPDQQPREL